MCMRSRISIIATVLSLIFAICLWNIIEMGGLYIFDNYYIVHSDKIEKLFKMTKFTDEGIRRFSNNHHTALFAKFAESFF